MFEYSRILVAATMSERLRYVSPLRSKPTVGTPILPRCLFSGFS